MNRLRQIYWALRSGLAKCRWCQEHAASRADYAAMQSGGLCIRCWVRLKESGC